MNIRKAFRVILVALLLLLLIPQALPAAASSSTLYVTTHLGAKNVDKTESGTAAFYKAKISKGKLIIYGGIATEDSSTGTQSHFKNYAKRTYKMIKNCKVGTYIDADTWCQFDTDTFNKMFYSNKNGTNRTLKLKTKNGKITKIIIT